MSGGAFPAGFLWGAATSAHQVEGGNWNNDWWAWEHTPGSPCLEASGDACDHYHRYAEDIGLLGDLGFTCYRFSLEWSRIEPEQNEFSTVALDHYRRMAEVCRGAGLLPIVTFHHFTTPRWVAGAGGWIEASTADRFARFCDVAAAHLGETVGVCCTINEPNIVATFGYLTGLFPPGDRDPSLRHRANEVFVDAHHKAVDAIRSHLEAPVGLTLAMSEWEPVGGGEAMLEMLREPMEDVYLEATAGDDFIGVQTYTRTIVGPDGPRPPDPGAATTLMGYEDRPEALAATIRRAGAATGLPVLVTENGIATDRDERRVEFMHTALRSVLDCVADGVEVLGYVHWSALDNFEWVFGYTPTFGLVAVDRSTQRRLVKPSGRWLGEVAGRNALPESWEEVRLE